MGWLRLGLAVYGVGMHGLLILLLLRQTPPPVSPDAGSHVRAPPPSGAPAAPRPQVGLLVAVLSAPGTSHARAAIRQTWQQYAAYPRWC